VVRRSIPRDGNSFAVRNLDATNCWEGLGQLLDRVIAFGCPVETVLSHSRLMGRTTAAAGTRRSTISTSNEIREMSAVASAPSATASNPFYGGNCPIASVVHVHCWSSITCLKYRGG
jgi:hypothetical protein